MIGLGWRQYQDASKDCGASIHRSTTPCRLLLLNERAMFNHDRHPQCQRVTQRDGLQQWSWSPTVTTAWQSYPHSVHPLHGNAPSWSLHLGHPNTIWASAPQFPRVFAVIAQKILALTHEKFENPPLWYEGCRMISLAGLPWGFDMLRHKESKVGRWLLL